MRARPARPSRLIAAGICAALSVAILTGCASGPVRSSSTSASSSSTSAGSSSATPGPTPGASGSSASPASGVSGAVPTDRPSNGPNAITFPASGATVPGPDVAVTGTGTGFEATLTWEVTPAAGGAPVAHGFTTAGANGQVGPFAFTAKLPAGLVTLAVWEPDMSDATAGTTRHNLVTATFTVQ